MNHYEAAILTGMFVWAAAGAWAWHGVRVIAREEPRSLCRDEWWTDPDYWDGQTPS